MDWLRSSTVNFTFSDVTTGSSEITIPKGFKIGSKIGGTSYSFLTKEAATAKIQSDLTTYYANNVVVREGVQLTTSQVVSGIDNELFEIPNDLADTDTLEVAVNSQKYNFAEDYKEID